VGGISSRSTRQGILTFLEKKGVHPTGLRLMTSGKGCTAAKVTVTITESYLVEETSFWPEGTRCRRWYGEAAWNQKLDNTNNDEGEQYQRSNKGYRNTTQNKYNRDDYDNYNSNEDERYGYTNSNNGQYKQSNDRYTDYNQSSYHNSS
jgi:hypothetical protein